MGNDCCGWRMERARIREPSIDSLGKFSAVKE